MTVEVNAMSTVIEAPIELVEEIAALRLPAKADQRLQELMDRNTNGLLDAQEMAELESWVDCSQNLALVRAKALQLLGRKPL
jgi:hypothetical protein